MLNFEGRTQLSLAGGVYAMQFLQRDAGDAAMKLAGANLGLWGMPL